MRFTRWLTVLLALPLLATSGHGVRFLAGRSALCIPFDAGNRHVAFRARLNDRDGMWLVLDTGASGSVIDAERAASLGLAARGQHQAIGSGGSAPGATVHGVDVTLPGFEMLDQTMGTLSLGSLAAQAGRALDGILGFPLFDRCVVEIDYARQCVSLYDKSTYLYEGAGVSIPITLIENTPYVDARVVFLDGRTLAGKFVIDTGASTNVILSPGPVEGEGVLASLGKTIAVRAHGVGGPTEVRLARAAKLELAGFSLDQPVTAIQPVGTGRISAPGTIGNIGGGVLSRFKVIMDYSRRRMILEPGPDFAKPFEADMSGLMLASLPPDFNRLSVARVLDGSPALEAGIRAGDEIESVDGAPAAELGLSALREKLRVDGQDFRFGVRRGEERLEVAMTTRRMI